MFNWWSNDEKSRTFLKRRITMELQTLMLGELSANCYIVDCGEGNCVAVDIGNDPQKLLHTLENKEQQLRAILLTHGHYDHVGGVEAVRKATGAQVYIHTEDAPMLKSEKLNLANQIARVPYTPVTEYHTLSDNETLTVGERTFRILHTPGHTPGSVCYLTGELLFSGDTLFRGSVGRTDFEGGSMQQMLASIKRLAELENDYEVYPGHFEKTTLAMERRSNPYLRKV
jgi:glyoxylase-like metal-dependent hydrolase (beta-lactamase superfamily II)